MGTVRKIILWLEKLSEQRYFFWFALFFLNILLFLPQTIFYSGTVQLIPLPPLQSPRGWYDTLLFFLRRENQDFFRLIAEYLVIISLLYITIRSKYRHIFHYFLLLLYSFLFIYQSYDAIMVRVFGESPILYNDLLLLKGAFYLLIDIIFTSKFLPIAGVILLLLIISSLIPFLFASVSRGLEKWQNQPKVIYWGAGLWGFVIIMTSWFGFRDFRSVVHWITPKITKNVQTSFTLKNILQKVSQNPADSSYFYYPQIQLQQKPNIFLILVESYGRILLEQQETKGNYLSYLTQLEDSLRQKGWKMASSFSRSPIFGGRSWLSMGTLLTGTLIKDEAIYSYLINKISHYPHLVHFLNSQGYHTFALQPLNRTRPGYTLTNYEKFYQYQTYINFQDLDFDGPAFGFRNIPDQYSLNYAYETYLKPATSPVFLFFLTVSSHSPWIDLPPYLEDWHTLKDQSQRRLSQKYAQTKDKLEESFLSHFSGGIGLNEYAEHMIYELHMIKDFILKVAPENSIIIIIGDHQPPITTDTHPSFDTPLHIISQNEDLIRSLEKFNFVNGLNLAQANGSEIKHEGFYSLLIRCLAENYAQLDSLPEYLPDGIPLSITP
jgi:hypothetical protein